MTLTPRARFLLAGLIGTFAVMRVALMLAPNADFNAGRFNIHHLFTGVLITTAAGLPLALRQYSAGITHWLTFAFGVGLSLMLDEWVYLIATDGSNAAYLTPVSLYGGIVCVGAAGVLTVALGRATARQSSDSK